MTMQTIKRETEREAAIRLGYLPQNIESQWEMIGRAEAEASTRRFEANRKNRDAYIFGA